MVLCKSATMHRNRLDETRTSDLKEVLLKSLSKMRGCVPVRHIVNFTFFVDMVATAASVLIIASVTIFVVVATPFEKSRDS